MDNKKLDNMSLNELKKSKTYSQLSKKCKSLNLNKIELTNLLKDGCVRCDNDTEISQYNILYKMKDFDLSNKREIGEGASAVVYLVKNKINNKKYILKKIHKQKCELVIEEMDILNKISSNCKKFFLCYEGYSYDKENIYLITNYIPHSLSLSEFLRTNNKKLTNLMKLFIAKQIVQGFIELHKENVAHMDIKPSNILIKPNLEIKIIDYGFSCIKENKVCYKKFKGTPNFISPEVVNQKVLNFEIAKTSDIWSIGITLYYIFNKKYPWSNNLSVKELLKKISKLKNPLTSDIFGNIINPMLVINVEKRKKILPSILKEINNAINNYK